MRRGANTDEAVCMRFKVSCPYVKPGAKMLEIGDAMGRVGYRPEECDMARGICGFYPLWNRISWEVIFPNKPYPEPDEIINGVFV